MDKLKQIADLITTATTAARACKQSLMGVKAYHRHPARFVYALNGLREETAELRDHATKLDDLLSQLCAACIPRTESNGTPEDVHHAHVASDS